MVAERLVGPLQVLNGLEEADLVNLARLILKGWNPFDPAFRRMENPPCRTIRRRARRGTTGGTLGRDRRARRRGP